MGSVLYDTKQGVFYKAVPRADVEAVDYILKLAQGRQGQVEGEGDWKVIEAIIEFCFLRFPAEMEEFKKSTVLIRQSRANKKAYSKSKEIKYIAALPARAQLIIRRIFQNQAFDKKFMAKLIKRIPLFRIGEV